MGVWNTGSVVDQVHTEVPDVPVRCSGMDMNGMVDMARIKVQRYAGVTISSTSIDEKYQPPILHFTCANVLKSMELEGSDATEVRIGEFVTKKGHGSNTSVSSKSYEDQAKEELKDLGRRSNYYQALG